MAESHITNVTPTKISVRNPACFLCGGNSARRHMVRIFGKAGTSKDLCAKVKKLCDIAISDDENDSQVLCRQCITFMDKMEAFIRKAQSLQEKPLEELSVKRCIEHSPSQQLAKRSVSS